MHPDLQTAVALTPNQMYAQFCWKAAKFDAEFALPDRGVISTWLNIGVKRLLEDMVKRIIDQQETTAITILKDYIEDADLTITKISDDRYKAEYGGTTSVIALWDLHIWKSLQLNPAPTSFDEFPKWWPSKSVTDSSTGAVTIEGISVMSDFIDITADYDENYNRIVNNSFADVYAGPASKVYLHKDVEEFPYTIITASPFQGIMGRRDVEPDANKTSYWRIDKVELAVLKHQDLFEDTYIDASIEDVAYTALPAILHNDIVDYAVDAYLEAQFLQTSGKQTNKMTRQEAAPVSPQQ